MEFWFTRQDTLLKKTLKARDFFVVIDNSNKHGWSIALKNETAQTITIKFSNTVRKSNPKPNLIETKDQEEIIKQIFTAVFQGRLHDTQ